MEIVNIIATVIMEKLFDLDELYNKLPNSEKTHVWVKVRIPPHNKYTAFYASGKFLITGVKSYNELNEIALNVANFLKENNIDNNISAININNHVLIDKLDFNINLDDLIIKLDSKYASYEPEQFPGLIYKYEDKITFMLFNSGKMNIVGVKSLDNIEDIIKSFKQLIYEKSLED